MKTVLALVVACFASSAFSADCVTNSSGKTVCAANGQAVGYNAKTGTAYKSNQNDTGITTTQGTRGGEAKTKNGKGVYQSPNGTKCVKTANNHGCK